MLQDNSPPIRAVTTTRHGKPYVHVEYVSGFPSVAILITNYEKILLLTIQRPLFGDSTQLEIPRGFGDSSDSLSEASRELFEETGLQGVELEEIGTIRADSGVLKVETRVFTGEVTETNLLTNSGELITGYSWLEIHEVNQSILAGEITDSYTIAALKIHEIHQGEKQNRTPSENPLYQFFLSDTMENMRHTEGKQLQLAISTIGGFGAAIFTVIETTPSTSFLDLNLRNLLIVIGISVWSIAASTKIMRYRAWKEHYSQKIREMTGRYFMPSVPVIYAPVTSRKTERRDLYRRRLLGDETLTLICVLVTAVSNFFLGAVLSRSILKMDSPIVLQGLLVSLCVGSYVLILTLLHSALKFQIEIKNNG